MSNYIDFSYRDREREYQPLQITELCLDIGRGKIKNEASKFILNGCNSYTHIRFNVFKYASFKDTDRHKMENFTNRYLKNPEINKTTLNPKVLAFCFLFCFQPTIEGTLFFYRPNADLLVRLLYSLRMKNTEIAKEYFKLDSLKEFIKENGINEVDIVRYLIFMENMENKK